MKDSGPQIMSKGANSKKACMNLISQPIVTTHKVLQGFTCGEQPWHHIFHHGITSCHKQPIFEKNEGFWASDHEQGCKFQKSMHEPHLPTYCDHSQSFARFYLWGTAMASHYTANNFRILGGIQMSEIRPESYF